MLVIMFGGSCKWPVFDPAHKEHLSSRVREEVCEASVNTIKLHDRPVLYAYSIVSLLYVALAGAIRKDLPVRTFLFSTHPI